MAILYEFTLYKFTHTQLFIIFISYIYYVNINLWVFFFRVPITQNTYITNGRWNDNCEKIIAKQRESVSGTFWSVDLQIANFFLSVFFLSQSVKSEPDLTSFAILSPFVPRFSYPVFSISRCLDPPPACVCSLLASHLCLTRPYGRELVFHVTRSNYWQNLLSLSQVSSPILTWTSTSTGTQTAPAIPPWPRWRLRRFRYWRRIPWDTSSSWKVSRKLRRLGKSHLQLCGGARAARPRDTSPARRQHPLPAV